MSNVTVTRQIHFSMRNRGRREIREGPKPIPEVTDAGRVPRVTRLMALAIKMSGLIESGAITDQAEAARLGHVSRARMTQIMNLLLLAPDIQEAILNLPRTVRGRDPIVETHLRLLVAAVNWDRQRRQWEDLVRARRADGSVRMCSTGLESPQEEAFKGTRRQSQSRKDAKNGRTQTPTIHATRSSQEDSA